MKLRIYSDIHQEFHRQDKLFEIPILPDDKETVLILAGDIDTLKHGFQFCNRHSDQFRSIIYIAGNHEYYYMSHGKLGEELRMIEKVGLNDNVHFLHNDSVIIGDVHFIGSTFWTDLPQSPLIRNDIMFSMNDFKRIHWGARCGYRKFNVNDWIALHSMAETYVKAQLGLFKDEYKKVVVTHHAPSWLSKATNRKSDSIAYAYYSDYDKELLSQADLWVHGHTHDSVDYKSEDCRVIANCRGYYETKIIDGELDFHCIDSVDSQFDEFGKLLEI